MTTDITPIRVGLLGIGTVGGGTFDVLTRNQAEITRRVGRPIVISRVADLDTALAESVVQGRAEVTADAVSVVTDPDIDVVVELIGGYGVAKDLTLQAIQNGKHVVTANKALLAVHGNEIFTAARENDVMVAFEAAVGGGIPIIKALREGLVANRIDWVVGIINGTTNFILSEMRTRGVGFEEALADAQANGYAEADPTFDVEGIDAGHKLALMCSMAFGVPVRFDQAHIEGVPGVEQTDIRYAEELGYRVKLLGVTRRREDGIELRVHPAMVPESALLANVEGVMNAVVVEGDAVGQTLHYGAGAGSHPTASAVIADLVDVARLITADPQHRVPHLAFRHDQMSDTPILDIDDTVTRYYLRLQVADQPGVLADVTRILAAVGISIEAAIQREAGDDAATVVLMTHESRERDVRTAIREIESLDSSRGPVVMMRVEKLD